MGKFGEKRSIMVDFIIAKNRMWYVSHSRKRGQRQSLGWPSQQGRYPGLPGKERLQGEAAERPGPQGACREEKAARIVRGAAP